MTNPKGFYKRIARLALAQGIATIENSMQGNTDALYANQRTLVWLLENFKRYHKAEAQGDEQAMYCIESGEETANHAHHH